jgi:hypothetical protein
MKKQFLQFLVFVAQMIQASTQNHIGLYRDMIDFFIAKKLDLRENHGIDMDRYDQFVDMIHYLDQRNRAAKTLLDVVTIRVLFLRTQIQYAKITTQIESEICYHQLISAMLLGC